MPTKPVKYDTAKCIAYGCGNHRHEEEFIGDLCRPCYEAITKGKLPVGGTAWFNLVAQKLSRYEKLCHAVAQAYQDYYSEDGLTDSADEEYAFISVSRVEDLSFLGHNAEAAILVMAIPAINNEIDLDAFPSSR